MNTRIKVSIKQMFITVCLISLLGCLQTPSEDYIVNREDHPIEDIIFQEQTPVVTDFTAGSFPPSVEESPSVPEKIENHEIIRMNRMEWSDSFSVNAAMDRIDIEICAEVDYPSSGTISIDSAHFAMPDNAETMKYVDYFLGHKNIYLADRTKTKAFYKAEMEYIISQMESETNSAVLRQWDMQLKISSDNYAKAPDALRIATWDNNMANDIDLMSQNDDGTYRFLKITPTSIAFELSVDTPSYLRTVDHLSPESESESNAVQIAQGVLDDLGISASLAGLCSTEKITRTFNARTQKDAFVLYYNPIYNGYPCTNTESFHGFDNVIEAVGGYEDEPYVPSYEKESITILVSEGNVLSFIWKCPHRSLRTENENVALISYTETQELFRKHIGKVMFVEKGHPMRLFVHSITLTLQRLPKKDTESEFYMIPVWEFIASVDSGNPFMDQNLQNCCVLRINALEGSIFH
jgi:hypothetical protein